MGISSIVPENMRTILDGILGTVLVFNDKGVVIYINDSGKDELGYKDGEVDIKEIFATLFNGNIGISEFIKYTVGNVKNIPVYRKNCTCFNAQIKVIDIQDSKQEKFHLVSIINMQYEVYARREIERAENAMKENMRARNEFIANITHELRTPVNGIKGHIKNLKSIEEDTTKKKSLDIVLKCCENMEKIINNFLDFSKIEAGKFEISESSFNFRNCINHVVDTSISIANEKGIKLIAKVDEAIPQMVTGDELRIVQILNNLVSNALKFTSIGYVSIEVYKTGFKHGRMELTFFVIDTGIGVTPQEKEKMFKSFSQVDGSITRKYGGTGLGLFVARQLVELMHGNISIDSEKGRGSTFTFNIEVGVEDGQSEEDNESSVIPQLLKIGHAYGADDKNIDIVYTYGTDENLKEIKNNMEKLSICIQMENWEKAEFFTDNIKVLANGAGKELKRQIFKLQMSVRKEDFENSIEYVKQIAKLMRL